MIIVFNISQLMILNNKDLIQISIPLYHFLFNFKLVYVIYIFLNVSH